MILPPSGRERFLKVKVQYCLTKRKTTTSSPQLNQGSRRIQKFPGPQPARGQWEEPGGHIESSPQSCLPPCPPGPHRDILRLSQSLQGTQVSLASVPVWGRGYQGPKHGKWGGVFLPRVTWRLASLFPFERDTGGTPFVVQWLRPHSQCRGGGGGGGPWIPSLVRELDPSCCH